MSVPPVKILMFGWEFPPFNSGGLGVACEGLVRGLAAHGADITFVLPKVMSCKSDACRFVFAAGGSAGVKVQNINALLSPYLDAAAYQKSYRALIDKRNRVIYRADLLGEVMRYASVARDIARSECFDVIHCHDWLALPAGLEAKKATGKPLVFHVHATEYDRVGEHAMNRDIYLVEKEGFEQADAIIAVSDYTRRVIRDHYGIDQKKITVVPNAVETGGYGRQYPAHRLKAGGGKVVLFVGRLTFQKGPDYFLRAARRVLDVRPDVLFVFAGSGDMERWLIEEAARMGIADNVFFAGFLRGEDLKRAYKMADLYVMPSVSDPFGLTALEAMASGTPVLASVTTGAAEMLSHCLKVDFWDVEQMANKMLAVVSYPELGATMRDNGSAEVQKFSWFDSAQKCLNIYQHLTT